MPGQDTTVASDPDLPFREIEVEKEENGLASDESLDVVRHEFLSDIDHLMSICRVVGAVPCSIGYFQSPLLPRLARTPFHSLQLVS